MKMMQLLIGLCCMLFWCRGWGQEQPLTFSLVEMFTTTPEERRAYNDNLQLPKGQWTSFDRMFRLPRFQRAMEYIALHDRTNLLGNLEQISAYYEFLTNHPIIIKHGLRWPGAATEVTTMLQLVPIGTLIGWISSKMYIEMMQLAEPEERVYREYEAMLDQGISESGQAFILGTASKQVVADVTRQYFGPLLRGEREITDPFEFDAAVLYQEQYHILQPNYYQHFNDLDRFLITGLFAEVYAKGLHDLEAKVDLIRPSDRFYLGMRKMGYGRERILGYLRGR